jgi:hypothetical protein
MTDDQAQQLRPVVLSLGSPSGYSGDDLTNPKDAVLAGEVPILRFGAEPDSPERSVVELRIHGVGGAPPEENLGSPNTIQVGGDATAGFFRTWTPGNPHNAQSPRREAYCWGKLNYRAASRALWLLLISFMIVNVAQWALPTSYRDGRDRIGLRWADAGSRAMLRLLGLLLTIAFVATAVTVAADLLAWQAAETGTLPSWLGWFAGWPRGLRLATGLGLALLVVAALHITSVRTAASYEKWSADVVPDTDDRWPLTQANFWNGARNVARQRGCHIGAGAGYVALIAATPRGSHPTLRLTAIIAASALIALSAILLVTPWTDRRRIADNNRQGLADRACSSVGIGACVLAVGLCVLRIWWVPRRTSATLPADLPLQIGILWSGFAVILALAVLVALQRPWHQPDVTGWGMAATLMALLAWLIAIIFGASFTLTLAQFIGSPKASVGTVSPDAAYSKLYVPATVYASGFAFLVTAIGAVVLAVLALTYRALAATKLARTAVTTVYPDPVIDAVPEPSAHTAGARRHIATLWAQAHVTDFAALGLALLALPTTLALLSFQIEQLVHHGQALNTPLQALSTLGSTIALAATGYFLVQLRSAFLNPSVRKRIGLIWDVGTFWPRACHPFAPPCYAERSIPEVVTRIRRITGENAAPHDPASIQGAVEWSEPAAVALAEQHSPVLLSGYSQGSPIAVAIAAQLSVRCVQDVALLTLAAPVRRLYGRTFPAFFGPECLDILRARFEGVEQTRWRNLVRRSDYIGGWVLHPIPLGRRSSGPIDHEILDPPVLWPDSDPTPPPAHLHSDWFPDPQTRPYADELMAMLRHGSAHTPTRAQPGS